MRKIFSFLLILVIATPSSNAQQAFKPTSVVTTDETARCLGCHSTRMSKLVETWEKSSHSKNGVGCYECHKAEKGDVASKQGHFGFNVQLSVSPARCGSCHQSQYEEFAASAHSKSFSTIKDHPLRKKSPILFESSCTSCHGTEVKMDKSRPLEYSWPNKGVGRVNTDGTLGSCAACHGAHTDSLAVARDPNTCGKCHNTGFSPAMDSWSLSPHGACFKPFNSGEVDFNKKHLNLSSDSILKPDCQSCHIMAATKNDKATHNPSSRLSWKIASLKAYHTDDWGSKRLEMEKSCKKCHGSTQVNQYFRKLDASIVATNHIAEDKVKNGLAEQEKLSLKHSLISFRIGVAMLGTVEPARLEELFK